MSLLLLLMYGATLIVAADLEGVGGAQEADAQAALRYSAISYHLHHLHKNITGAERMVSRNSFKK